VAPIILTLTTAEKYNGNGRITITSAMSLPLMAKIGYWPRYWLWQFVEALISELDKDMNECRPLNI